LPDSGEAQGPRGQQQGQRGQKKLQPKLFRRRLETGTDDEE
jgi:hypothetical protein